MLKTLLAGAAALAIAAPALAAGGTIRVSGQATAYDGRTFAVSATIYSDGTVRGQANLINRVFTGDNPNAPYHARFELTCAKRIDANTIILGGLTTRSNDTNPVVNDAVYFAVQDNGGGAGSDRISPVYFFDDDPNTFDTGQLCAGSTLADLPLFEDPATIVKGNIKVR